MTFSQAGINLAVLALLITLMSAILNAVKAIMYSKSNIKEHNKQESSIQEKVE